MLQLKHRKIQNLSYRVYGQKEVIIMKIKDNGKRFHLGLNPRVKPLAKMPYDLFITWGKNQTFVHSLGCELYIGGEWRYPYEMPDSSIELFG